MVPVEAQPGWMPMLGDGFEVVDKAPTQAPQLAVWDGQHLRVGQPGHLVEIFRGDVPELRPAPPAWAPAGTSMYLYCDGLKRLSADGEVVWAAEVEGLVTGFLACSSDGEALLFRLEGREEGRPPVLVMCGTSRPGITRIDATGRDIGAVVPDWESGRVQVVVSPWQGDGDELWSVPLDGARGTLVGRVEPGRWLELDAGRRYLLDMAGLTGAHERDLPPPSWSADGRWVAFSHRDRRGIVRSGVLDTGSRRIWLADSYWGHAAWNPADDRGRVPQ